MADGLSETWGVPGRDAAREFRPDAGVRPLTACVGRGAGGADIGRV